MTRTRLVTLVAAALFPAFLPIEGLAQERQPQPPAVFRAGVELVRLDVRIQDREGRPIQDLKPDEIEVREGSERRPIVLFQHVAEPEGSYLEVARRTVGAEVSTNRGAPRGHLYVFVFDQNHIRPGNEQRARNAAQRFLRTRVRPGDRVALYALPGPGPQVPFTSNPQLVAAQLPAVRGALDRESYGALGAMSAFEAFQVVRGNQQVMQRILTRASESGGALDVSGRPTSAPRGTASNTAAESLQMANQIILDSARTVVGRADAEARTFLLALADVVKELAPIEGRKSVILVSEGFFTDNLVHDVERVAAAAAQSYAVIYSLDINARGADIQAAQPVGGEAMAEVQSRLEALGTLASETDGELVLDANSQPDAAFARVAANSLDYYVLGFEAPAEALADRARYRRLSVTVRRPGARVSTRTGYSLGEPGSGSDRRRSIDLALAAPFPQQGLPIDMTTYVLHGMSPGAHRVFMALEAELPVSAGGPGKPADIVFVARHVEDGRTVASGTDTIRLPSTPADGQARARGRFQVQFDAPPGEYLMRVVVREPGGTTGSVDRRFVVRALDGIDLTASDLLLGPLGGELPVRATGYTEDGVSAVMELYARRRQDLEAAEVTMELIAIGADTAISSVRADLQDLRANGAGYARRVRADMPLGGIAPGEYVVRARLRAHGESVTELSRQLLVVPGSAPAMAASPAPVTPDVILGSDLVQALVARTGRGGAPNVAAASARAVAGKWDQVEAALGPPAPAEGEAARTLRGLAAFGQERYDEAAAALQGVLDADPKAASTAFVLGWVHALAGRSSQAVTAWRGAIAGEPGMVSAYLALADMYVRLSHPELARQALQAGLRAVPGSLELASRLEEVEKR